MKQITTLLAAIVLCIASSVAVSAQTENTLPKKFFGCTLNETTNLDAKIYLESNGFVPSDYSGGFYYISDPKFDGIKYDLALLEFTPHDMASDVFSAITFMKTGMSRIKNTLTVNTITLITGSFRFLKEICTENNAENTMTNSIAHSILFQRLMTVLFSFDN